MRCSRWLLGARLEMSETKAGQLFRRIILENVRWFWDRNHFFFQNKSWTPLHVAFINSKKSTCQLLCALDGVDQNAVNNYGDTAVHFAVRLSHVDCARTLLEFNVDTSKARVMAWTEVEIVQLFDEHRKRSVKILNFFICLKWNFAFAFIRFFYNFFSGNWTNCNSKSSARRTTSEDSEIFQIWSGKYI